MNLPLPTAVALADAPIHRPLAVASLADDAVTRQRLLTFGWRLGAPLTVVRRSSGGARIIGLGGARVAVGGALARDLTVAVVS